MYYSIKTRRLIKIFIVEVVLFALLAIILMTAKDNIVIIYGIKIYKILQNIMSYVLAVMFLTVIIININLVQDYSRNKRFKEKVTEMDRQQKQKEEDEKKESETLSVRRNLDSDKVKELLLNINWTDKNVKTGLSTLRKQLVQMDEQQNKLQHLIQTNGASSLADSSDVLDKAEQYMCKNVRKVINYIDIADENSAEDKEKVIRQIKDCNDENQNLLTEVKEFMFAMADFLNSQGDDDNSIQTLEIYKETILNAIG